MNKKRYIVPSIVLSVSVILLVATLIFTTSFVFCSGLNTFNSKRVEMSMPLSELAYKISPCYSNLRALYDSYNCFRYYSPYDEKDAFDMGDVPEDYYKQSMKYSKLMYEYYEANPEAYKSNPNSSSSFDAAYMSQSQALASIMADYIVALYLDGQKGETQRVVNEFVNNLPDDKTMYSVVIIPISNTVHDFEEDVDYQKWMVEVEEKITKAYYDSTPDAENKTDNFFMRSEYYKPFDWQK